jgi:hypothetical protein
MPNGVGMISTKRLAKSKTSNGVEGQGGRAGKKKNSEARKDTQGQNSGVV